MTARLMRPDRTLKTPDGETFVLENTFTEDEFAAITSQVTNAEGKTVTNHDYTNYVVPARQAYAHQTTVQHPGALIGFYRVEGYGTRHLSLTPLLEKR